MKVFDKPTLDTAINNFQSVVAQPKIPTKPKKAGMFTETKLFWEANSNRHSVVDMIENEKSKRRFASNGFVDQIKSPSPTKTPFHKRTDSFLNPRLCTQERK